MHSEAVFFTRMTKIMFSRGLWRLPTRISTVLLPIPSKSLQNCYENLMRSISSEWGTWASTEPPPKKSCKRLVEVAKQLFWSFLSACGCVWKLPDGKKWFWFQKMRSESTFDGGMPMVRDPNPQKIKIWKVDALSFPKCPRKLKSDHGARRSSKSTKCFFLVKKKT